MIEKIPKVRTDSAISFFGGRTELAKFLGISVEAIMNRQRGSDPYLPERRVMQIMITKPDAMKKLIVEHKKAPSA